ncbi:MAG: DUF3086 domain-containing protein [Cyanobacteria bacterium]|nr:DUF3086 domain-containing protein [Cyanobacteriota bacterium]
MPLVKFNVVDESWQQLALQELQQKRIELQAEITALESRKTQLQLEINSHFVGNADGLSRRVKGFQDYLTGALQDLARSVEQLPLIPETLTVQPSPLDFAIPNSVNQPPEAVPSTAIGIFSNDADLIVDRLTSFNENPDFYAEPWQLRRSLDENSRQLLQRWFLDQGGRGAQPSGGSRNRNVLVAAAAIAILGELYGERFQTLVLAGEPERLGDWRRGLQDCLGLTREDFGPNSGVVLFERHEALVERADRLEEKGELPFIVVDAAEATVAIPILQFPLWLLFAADPQEFNYQEDLL